MIYSPQYLRHRQSLATTEEGSLKSGLSKPVGEEGTEDGAEQREKNEEQLRLAGLRRRNLLLLFAWLGLVSFLALLLLILHISLLLVLQMSPKGMHSMRIYSYEDPQTGKEEPAVHFSERVNLGQVVAKSGQVLGPRNEQLDIRGSRVLLAGGDTRALFQEGQCRLEGADQFQIRQPAGDKVLFSARHPLVGIDKRIKRISSALTITNKLRAPVNSSMHISAEDLGLRGNERIQMEARRVNLTAGTDIRLATSEDGSLRLSARRLFLGGKWLSLPLSPSPALSASVDAFRVCLCRSSRREPVDRPKLFLVPGNRPCSAPATICQ